MSPSKVVLTDADLTRFRELQASLSETWPYMTTRRVGDTPRTLIVINSMNMELPAHMYPVVPAYEERFLFLMLAAVKNPGTHVIYVTSQPIPPRLVDYYMSLMPGSRPTGLDQRIHLVSVGDGSPRPLVDKILERPLLVQRLKSQGAHSPFRLIFPFNTTPKEVLLGNLLDTPVYGPDPTLASLGSKSGSRQTFAEAGIPYPDGVERVFTVDDVIAALEKLRAANPTLRATMVKLDDLAGGLGNAVVRLEGVDSEADLQRRVENLEGEDQEVTRCWEVRRDRRSSAAGSRPTRATVCRSPNWAPRSVRSSPIRGSLVALGSILLWSGDKAFGSRTPSRSTCATVARPTHLLTLS